MTDPLIEDRLRHVTADPRFRSMDDVLEAAGEIVGEMRAADPDALRDWLWDNARLLLANQILSRSVQSLAARKDVLTLVRQAVAEWRDLPDERPALAAWLQEERPLLLRAWFHASIGDRLECEISTWDSAAAAVVDEQVAAYNAHDIETFLSTYAEHAEVVTPRGTRRGRDALRAAYEPIFAAGTCRAEIIGRLAVGNCVVDLEVASGLSPTPVRALMAYRVEGTTISAAHTIALQSEGN